MSFIKHLYRVYILNVKPTDVQASESGVSPELIMC